MLDLNSIAIEFLPAYSMKIEHPTGPEFAQHLRDIAEYFELPVQENTDVKSIEKKQGLFHLETNQGTLFANNVIWSAGEYQYPCTDVLPAVNCAVTPQQFQVMLNWKEMIFIIGGYESGVDAAYHLANRNKKVRLFDLNAPWDAATSDPSVALSTYSFERMRNPNFEENTELYPETIVNSVTLTDGIYEVNTEDGQTFQSKVQPLLAAGFDGSHK